MQRFSMVVRQTFVFSSLIGILILCGCSLFNLHEDTAAVLGIPAATSGSANVAFNIVVPGHANLTPSVRAAETGAEVTFRVTLLQPGSTTNPTITFLKKVAVQSDGSATVSFSSLPEGAAIGEITIAGGNIGGKSMFHGASDLFPGDNTITVSPKGSLHESDILANAMLAIAADPELIKISKPNLVTNAANAAATFIANPTDDVYARVFESITSNPLAFDATKYTQIDISSLDGTIRGMGLTIWSKTPDQFWQETQFAGAGMLPINVVRQGIGDYAMVYWETPTKNSRAFSKFSNTAGTLLNYLYSNGANGFIPQGSQILPGDGSIVVAGSYAGKPALVRWNGIENTDLSTGLTASGLKWNSVFEIASVDTASAAISYLEYDRSGTGKILCTIKDPSAGNRLFFVDPSTGVATEQQQNNNFGLWAQAGSGTVALGWDGIEVAASYKVYYATGTVLATATAPLVSTTEKVLIFENLVNDQAYSFQVAAIASEGQTLAWSTVVEATPAGAADPIIYSNWKLATSTFEIGSSALAGVNILSYDENSQIMRLEITETVTLGLNAKITGVYNGKPLCVKLGAFMPVGGTAPPPPPGTTTPGTTAPGTYEVVAAGASMEEIFDECKFFFKGKMSQLPVMSERLLSPADPLYQSKVLYLRGGMRPSLRGAFTSQIDADPSYGAISLEMANFELDPDVVVDFSTSFGSITQFEMRVDGYAACEIYLKLLATAGVELPAIEGTLLPHSEIPFFVGPVPGTWAREVTAYWKLSLNAEAEIKAGTKMRVDFRSGANYYRESGWDGQLLWRVKNTPIFEASLKGTFTNESAIEMKNALKVGGLAGPELTLKPYIKSEATLSSEKPCEVNAGLSMGLQGELKAIVQAWSYNIGEWGGTFEPFGPWVIASHTLSANATPTLVLTGPYNLENMLKVTWDDNSGDGAYYPHVFSSTGADSFVLTMDDSKGLNQGLSKVEVSVDGNPAFATFELDADVNSETGISLTPYPKVATLTMPFPFTIDKYMVSSFGTDMKWYTPFRLPPGPHELMFKVYDRCGDQSIATHAIWILEEPDLWQVKNDVGSLTWEVSIDGFERGNLPERVRTIEPVPGGLDISPIKNGDLFFYRSDGKLMVSGSFTNNIRSGIWQEYFLDEFDNTASYSALIEFDSAGKPLKWLRFADFAEENYVDKYLQIKPSTSPAEFTLITDDLDYIRPLFRVGSFTQGIRVIGLDDENGNPKITTEENEVHTETFTDGKRNGEAKHTSIIIHTSTDLRVQQGNYLEDVKHGTWTEEYFVNSTSSYVNSFTFVNGVLEGPCSKTISSTGHVTSGTYSQNMRTGTWVSEPTTANYANDKPHGAFSTTYAGGSVTGSYNNGVAVSPPWPIIDSEGATIGSYNPPSDPISISPLIPGESPTRDANDVENW